MKKKKPNPHFGSSLDDFLKEEGIYDELYALVIKEKIAFQLKKSMAAKHHVASISVAGCHFIARLRFPLLRRVWR